VPGASQIRNRSRGCGIRSQPVDRLIDRIQSERQARQQQEVQDDPVVSVPEWSG
jgi:hypothetical protein